jgi:hypothetical protein
MQLIVCSSAFIEMPNEHRIKNIVIKIIAFFIISPFFVDNSQNKHKAAIEVNPCNSGEFSLFKGRLPLD